MDKKEEREERVNSRKENFNLDETVDSENGDTDGNTGEKGKFEAIMKKIPSLHNKNEINDLREELKSATDIEEGTKGEIRRMLISIEKGFDIKSINGEDNKLNYSDGEGDLKIEVCSRMSLKFPKNIDWKKALEDESLKKGEIFAVISCKLRNLSLKKSGEEKEIRVGVKFDCGLTSMYKKVIVDEECISSSNHFKNYEIKLEESIILEKVFRPAGFFF
jgi:hypothetical protein